jgi:CheY-like chemotaxis protein
MTGVQVYIEIIRQAPLPCIFMTAEAEDDLVELALRQSPLGVLRKPFEVCDFRDLVRRAIG